MYLWWWNHCEYKVYRIELRTLEVLKYQLSFSVFTIPLGLFPMALMPPYYIYYFNKNFNFLYVLIYYFRALKMVGFLKNKMHNNFRNFKKYINNIYAHLDGTNIPFKKSISCFCKIYVNHNGLY